MGIKAPLGFEDHLPDRLDSGTDDGVRVGDRPTVWRGNEFVTQLIVDQDDRHDGPDPEAGDIAQARSSSRSARPLLPVFPPDESCAPTGPFALELRPSRGLQSPCVKPLHPLSHPDLPGSPPGGRSGPVQGEKPVAGGAADGFEVPIGLHVRTS